MFEIAFCLILPSYKAMECTYSSLSPRFGAANVHLKAYQYAIIFFACAVRVFSCFRWRCYSDPPPTQRHVRQRLVSTANLGTYWPRNCGKYRKQGNHETPDASFELPGTWYEVLNRCMQSKRVMVDRSHVRRAYDMIRTGVGYRNQKRFIR